MTLAEYCRRKGRGAKQALSHDSRLAYSTIRKAVRGEPLDSYATAKALSDATGGLVSVLELLEPGGRPKAQETT